MDVTASSTRAAGRVRTVPKGLLAASFVLGGTLLSLTGLVWDIQWHFEVGPDTFFTLPHLVLYAGSAMAGLASLIVVLATTAAQRRGDPVDPVVGGRAVNVFGRTFTAPIGYLVSGTGAAGFLLYGLWDQWWHGLYGFDAMLESPPHIGFLLCIALTMVGAVMVSFAAYGRRWAAVTAVLGLAVLLEFSTATVDVLNLLGGGAVDPPTVGLTFMSMLAVVLGGHVLDRPGGALGVALALAALQGIFWWFAPWATRVYAAAIGLPMRDYVNGVPMLPAMMPMCLLVAAGVVELLRARVGTGTRHALLAGGIGGLVVAITLPLQGLVLGLWPDVAVPLTSLIATAAAGAVAGVGAGFLGLRFSQVLRHLAPAKEGR